MSIHTAFVNEVFNEQAFALPSRTLCIFFLNCGVLQKQGAVLDIQLQDYLNVKPN